MTTALGRGTTSYRGDAEWKGKLILWRAHDIINTSRGPSPPTPTNRPMKGICYKIALGPQKVVDQLHYANAANPTDLFGSERLRRLQFDVMPTGIGMAMVVNGDVYEAH